MLTSDRATLLWGTTIMTTTKFGLAQPVRRVEDPRLLKGAGRYTDDIVLPGMLFGVVLRSPHAAAAITRLDTTAAAALPGVAGVYTAADLWPTASAVPCAALVENRDGSPQAAPPHPVLADGRRAPRRRSGRLHRRRQHQAGA